MAKKVAPKKLIRDEDFAKRLQLASDNNTLCPPLHYGRLTWIVKQFWERFGEEITTETVRKWMGGEVRPRPKSMALLAQLLGVDHAWLSLGNAGETSAAESKARNVMAGAAVNLIAGLIEMDGGHPSYPDAGDQRSKDVDIFAIIKGAHYGFKVSPANNQNGKTYQFAIPSGYKDVFVIGLVRTGPSSFDMLELDAELITKHKENKGSHVSVTVEKRGANYTAGGQKVKQLSGFAERP
jgi:hypothetical protein